MDDLHPTLLPSASWAAALGLREPLPIALLSLPALAGPIPPPLPTLLSATEQDRYQSFRHPKRQQEWLGGRITAKAAVATLLTTGTRPAPAATTLVIASDHAGKPRLELPGLAQTVHLSISHSHNQAVAMASFHPCGIDLQISTSTAARVKERFTTPAEETLLTTSLGEHSETMQLTLLWAAKEALRKMMPISPLLGFHDAVLTGIQPADKAHLLLFSSPKMCHNTPHPLRVVATVLGEYALALSVLPTTATTATTD